MREEKRREKKEIKGDDERGEQRVHRVEENRHCGLRSRAKKRKREEMRMGERKRE